MVIGLGYLVDIKIGYVMFVSVYIHISVYTSIYYVYAYKYKLNLGERSDLEI